MTFPEDGSVRRYQYPTGSIVCQENCTSDLECLPRLCFDPFPIDVALLFEEGLVVKLFGRPAVSYLLSSSMGRGRFALGTLCSRIANDLTITLGRVEARKCDLIAVREAVERNACMMELTTIRGV